MYFEINTTKFWVIIYTHYIYIYIYIYVCVYSGVILGIGFDIIDVLLSLLM